MIVDSELDGLLAVFRAETAENLAEMEQSLLTMEARGEADTELLRGTLRAAHTVKGNAAMVGYEDVVAVAHELEDSLEKARDGVLEITPAVISMMLDGVDSIRALLEGRNGGDALRTTHHARRSLRVDVTRLDTLLDLTGEITIASGRLAQRAGDDAMLWQLQQLHAALQGEVMALRMVPLGPVFDAQQRAVRDVAMKLGKQVRMSIAGHDVEVDTSIAEQMRDPLTHMVRNAVDHGLESQQERQAAGKSAEGTVSLRASHQAGMVVIELSDDGRGLDRDRIAAKAIASGLITDAGSLSDDEVFQLIFAPGFSTAHEVTSVSGRGVGMDVAKRHVEALRGSIDIASRPGHGTTFTIRLPLTVAIISGFTVGVAGERYVLPLEAVEECVDFDTARAQGNAAEGILSLRGSPLPYLRLREIIAISGRPQGSPLRDRERSSVVVVRHGERRIGLVVDVLEGDCQAVIKPLSGGLDQLPGISGSTILGDGRVALILNVPQLIDSGRFTCCAR